MGLFDFFKKDKKEEINEQISEQQSDNLEQEFDTEVTYTGISEEIDITDDVEIGLGLEILDESKFEEELIGDELFVIDSGDNRTTEITETVAEEVAEIITEEPVESQEEVIVEPELETMEELIEEVVIEETENTTVETSTEEISVEETQETIIEMEEEVAEEAQETVTQPVEDIVEETTVDTNSQSQPEGLFAKMKKGLLKTKDSFTSSIDNVFKAFSSIDDDFYDELEETLILADLGARTSMDIIETLRDKVAELKIKDTEEVKKVLIDIISEILNKDSEPLEIKSPTVILVIGVNGAGKTTSIGKLANLYKAEGKSVLLAAGDTFRAAAIEQLEEWGRRSDITVIKHAENADSSAVIYDAIKSSQSKNIDVLICDTAGRLHNKKNLMAELEKINRVIAKEYSNANLETFLVLDGTAGQNALEQAKQFNEVCNISGLVLTKLDGTAKGGIIISIKNEMQIPVRYIGVGESIEDLQTFDSAMFAKALFDAE